MATVTPEQRSQAKELLQRADIQAIYDKWLPLAKECATLVDLHEDEVIAWVLHATWCHASNLLENKGEHENAALATLMARTLLYESDPYRQAQEKMLTYMQTHPLRSTKIPKGMST